MGLAELPTEILGIIINTLSSSLLPEESNEQRSQLTSVLYNLALTCRRLSTYATRALYHDLRISDLTLVRPAKGTPSAYQLFLRSCNENPSLIQKIHTARLGWLSVSKPNVRHDVLLCLGKSQTLNDIFLPQSWWNTCHSLSNLSPELDVTTLFTNVRILRLGLFGRNRIQQFWQAVCTLPELTELHITGIHQLKSRAAYWEDEISTLHTMHKMLKLIVLHLSGEWIDEEVLQTFVSNAPRLQQLILSERRMSMEGGVVLQPCNTPIILQPLARSLTSLTIFPYSSNRYTHIHIDSAVGFPQFRSLQALDIPQSYWLSYVNFVPVRIRSVEDSKDLLPPNITTLTLRSFSLTELFFTEEEVIEITDHVGPRVWHDVWKPRISMDVSDLNLPEWVTSLTLQKVTKYPHLASITLSEEEGPNGYGHFKDLSPRYEQFSCKSNDVMVKLILRVPDFGSS